MREVPLQVRDIKKAVMGEDTTKKKSKWVREQSYCRTQGGAAQRCLGKC